MKSAFVLQSILLGGASPMAQGPHARDVELPVAGGTDHTTDGADVIAFVAR